MDSQLRGAPGSKQALGQGQLVESVTIPGPLFLLHPDWLHWPLLNSTGLQSVLLVFTPYEKLIPAFKFLQNKVLNKAKGSVPLCRSLPEALVEWEQPGGVKHPSWLPSGLTGTSVLHVWAAITRYLHFWIIQWRASTYKPLNQLPGCVWHHTC